MGALSIERCAQSGTSLAADVRLLTLIAHIVAQARAPATDDTGEA